MTPGTLVHAPSSELARFATIARTRHRLLGTRIFAQAARLNALYMIKKAGSGHIGSSFSSLDLVSWIHLHGLRPSDDGAGFRDVYFSSKGHDVPGLYSVLIGLGQLEEGLLHRLRRLGGLPGHPDVGTPHIPTNTGSLGMGISKARGMILAHRHRGQERRVFVLTGDGELQEGQFWESLQPTVNRGIHELTVIVDHNKLQSDGWVRSVSDLGALEAKLEAFGWRVRRISGHDMEAIDQTLGATTRDGGPWVILADTVKGKGVSFMEAFGKDEKLYRFHSGAPSDAHYQQASEELVGSLQRLLEEAGEEPLRLVASHIEPPPRPLGPAKLVAAYSRALVSAAERRPDLVALDADLLLDTGLVPFSERFPERLHECGIAEQDMVSQAGGMALAGLLPIVHSFACFLSARPNEQIYNNATERRKVLYVGSLAGLVPGGPGHSHQCVRDISALAAVPGLLLVEPASEKEVETLLPYLIDNVPQSVYLRLVSVPVKEVPFPDGPPPRVGRGVTLREGRDVVIFGYGPVVLPEALEAAEQLAAASAGEGSGAAIHARVVNLPWLNRVDASWLREVVGDSPRVVCLDNHYTAGGQGVLLAAALAELGLPSLVGVLRIGVEEVPACGRNDEVLRAHGLDAASLAARIRAFHREGR